MSERPYVLPSNIERHLDNLEQVLFGDTEGRFLEEFTQRAEQLQTYIRLLEGGLGTHEARETVWPTARI